MLKLPTQDLPIPGTSWKIPLGLVRFFKYRDRVLDTWVNQHWQFAESEFLQLPNVAARQIQFVTVTTLVTSTITTGFGLSAFLPALFNARINGWEFIERVHEESRITPVMLKTVSENQTGLNILVGFAARRIIQLTLAQGSIHRDSSISPHHKTPPGIAQRCRY